MLAKRFGLAWQTVVLIGMTNSGVSLAGGCPPHPLGVSHSIVAGRLTHFAVAKAEALSESPGSIELAAAEARIDARHQLLKSDIGSSISPRALRGVMDISTCSIGDVVYAMVEASEENIHRSRRLNADIENSIKAAPTPQPLSY